MDISASAIDKNEVDRFTAYQKTFFFTKVDGVYPVDILNTHLDVHTPDIRKIFSDRHNENIEKIDELARRTLHYVYRVKTDKGSRVIRINAAGDFYRELSFYTEHWMMLELEKKSLPHVTIIDIDTTRSLVPFDYQIVEDLPGETLFDRSLHTDIPVSLFGQLGSFIASIHEMKTSRFGPISIQSIIDGKPHGLHETWMSYLILNMVSHIESCSLVGVITQKEATEIATQLSKFSRIAPFEPSILHGDVANHNTFVNGGKVAAIIDWEDCLAGDPVYDIAYYGSGCFEHEVWFDVFLSGYKSIRTLPEDFDLRFWLYYLRISLVKALIRERYMLKHNTYLPNARNRIMHALSRVKSIE